LDNLVPTVFGKLIDIFLLDYVIPKS